MRPSSQNVLFRVLKESQYSDIQTIPEQSLIETKKAKSRPRQHQPAIHSASSLSLMHLFFLFSALSLLSQGTSNITNDISSRN